MTPGATVFQLNSDSGQLFDGSTRGIAVLSSTNTTVPGDSTVQLRGGSIQVARHAALDALQAFTISATVTPQTLPAGQSTILESQTPPVSLHLDPTGKVFGLVNTAAGWQSVDSGASVVQSGATAAIQFTRDAQGAMALQVNGASAGAALAPGNLVSTGASGLVIGSSADGQKSNPFNGSIADLRVVNDVVTAQDLADRQATVQSVLTAVKSKVLSKNIGIFVDPDTAVARLQRLRSILTAAGVSRLSDLSTLQLTAPITMTPNRVLVAAKPFVAVPWSQIATELSSASPATVQTRLAQYLTNRNSVSVVKRLSAVTEQPVAVASPPPSPVLTPSPILRVPPPITNVVQPGVTAALGVARTSVTATSTGVGSRLPINPALLNKVVPVRPVDVLQVAGDTLKVADSTVFDRLTSKQPADWLVIGSPVTQYIAETTIPVDSAVIIAQTLDLTSTTLLIDPAVTTLYIIAEEVICGAGAQITWAQAANPTPPRLDDADLNGRDMVGTDDPNSRNGFRGGDGLGGASGLGGAGGGNAPAIEMWVKTLTAIPNINLDGQDGSQGGLGQRGGRGGDGGNGQLGHRYWLFGWHCDTQGGDGGDGGNGGSGGAGGPGGNGGSSGSITVGTLKGTLASTVTSKSFLLKNQGGQPGLGGPGGAGGPGGSGGQSGNGETCHDARAGHPGQQAQPGGQGAAGALPGVDSSVSFFEFTENDWDELLTRPWISKTVPTDIAPGETLTIFGSAFTTADKVIIDGVSFTPTINTDQSISLPISLDMTGGSKPLSVRRDDGTESNRLTIGIMPQLDAVQDALAPDVTVTLTGHAFLTDATVLINGQAVTAIVTDPKTLSFQMPGTGGSGSAGGNVSVQVRNPDGLTSGAQTAMQPLILEIPFKWGVNNLSFINPTSGSPDWGTYQDTFGSVEVWSELLDPIFGHPVLTAAFFAFYVKFLKGQGDGGLCTGFCTSVASKVADDLWTGRTDTHSLALTDDLRRWLTGVHGKLLSRQSLLHFHDQGRQGLARVEQTVREIEATFLRGCDRNSAPLLFVIPSGEVWDSGYFDRLSSSHCVMPYRFVYPSGHPGPALSANGTTTVTSLDKVKLYVWDTNNPESQDCRAELTLQDGAIHFQYFPGKPDIEFTSEQGVTLGEWTNGNYLLGNHDLPFAGPLGLTTFIIDFLLSPADLQVTDVIGNRTGTFGTEIHSDIPGSHPCYLAKGMFLLPSNTALSRNIVGNGSGSYDYHSIMPNQGSLLIEKVSTAPGQLDSVSISADGTQVRFSAGADKTFNLTVARLVNNQARALWVSGVGAAPGADIDLTIAPDLSVLRLGNQGVARSVQVSAFSLDSSTNVHAANNVPQLQLPTQHDLVVTVPDWTAVNVSAQAVSFN